MLVLALCLVLIVVAALSILVCCTPFVMLCDRDQMISIVDYMFSDNCITLGLLFSVRIVSPMPCALSRMMPRLLKLMKHKVLCRFLYWRHLTWLSELHCGKFVGIFFCKFAVIPDFTVLQFQFVHLSAKLPNY